MFDHKAAQFFRVFGLSLLCTLLISSPLNMAASAAGDEQAVWNLEHDYWRYVEANDLTAYLNLWHKNFLGWPSMSDAPARKDHITDSITSQRSKGLTFKAGEFKPADIQITGNIAVACYWMTFKWRDKNGHGDEITSRIEHTWVKDGAVWHILSGMSMSVPAAPAK
jgi:ketosteroid isomerase-like protein